MSFIPSLLAATAGKLGASVATQAAVGNAAIAVGSALPSVGTAAAVAGTGLGVLGALQAGEAQGRQADIEAGFTEPAATEELTRASEERTAAAQTETERRRKGRRDIASVVARSAASGIELAGTPLLQITDFLTDIEADVSNIRSIGAKKASAAEGRARTASLRGLTLKQLGKARKTQSQFKAGRSLLTGIGGVFT